MKLKEASANMIPPAVASCRAVILFVFLGRSSMTFHKSETDGSAVSSGFSDATVIKKVTDDQRLFDFETIQLTDSDLSIFGQSKVVDTSLFDFPNTGVPSKARARCKTYPGDLAWPTEPIWDLFDDLLGGTLIKTVPEASLCYPEWGRYSAAECQDLTRSWSNSTLR